MKINDDFRRENYLYWLILSNKSVLLCINVKKTDIQEHPPSNHRSMLKMLSMNKKKCVSPTQLLSKLSSPPQDDMSNAFYI